MAPSRAARRRSENFKTKNPVWRDLIERNAARIEYVDPSTLTPYPRNARTHSARQIRLIEESIKQFGFVNPIIVDESGRILAGHGRTAAAQRLGMKTVPVIRVGHLSETEKRAYALAENAIAAKAGWSQEMLAIEFGELGIALPEIGLDLGITGFSPAEIDKVLVDFANTNIVEDELPVVQQKAVSQLGDVWRLGSHRLLCGDAREARSYADLLGTDRAAMIFTDPPYNVTVNGHVRGRRRNGHREFVAASGEMTSQEFVRFLTSSLGEAARVCANGAIAFVCMDWRHMAEMVAAGGVAFTEFKNLCVWVKSNSGQGSFYRSQHELVFVYKVGTASHRNNFELGQFGRTRTNVWNYAGVNSFRAGRDDDLAMHPTVKPVAMVADAMKDCSQRGEIILDPFCGSGTVFAAAEQVGRRGYGIELDPLYVDVAIRRWQKQTGCDATLEATGHTFDALADGTARAAKTKSRRRA